MEAEWLEEFGWRMAGSIDQNPYTSLKLIQSGTLANDLYRKNAWLVVYEHHPVRERTQVRGGRASKRSAKAAVKHVAKALLGTMAGPMKRLLRKR